MRLDVAPGGWSAAGGCTFCVAPDHDSRGFTTFDFNPRHQEGQYCAGASHEDKT
jgi:hypothetical protein